MSSKQFCRWLEGMFIVNNSNCFNKHEYKIIKEKLKEVNLKLSEKYINKDKSNAV